MSFFRNHGLLVLGLLPVIYLFTADLESQTATMPMKIFWVFGFVCMAAYVYQRMRATRDQLRPPPSNEQDIDKDGPS